MGRELWSLVQTAAQGRTNYCRLPKAVFIRVLNISKDGDSTTSLQDLFLCVNTLAVIVVCLFFLSPCVLVKFLVFKSMNIASCPESFFLFYFQWLGIRNAKDVEYIFFEQNDMEKASTR